MRHEAVRRRRLIVLGAAVLAALALAAGVVVAQGGGSGPAIADAAAKLVPADALVYVHLSTDPDREAVRDAQALGDRFAGYERLRDSVLERLAVGGGDEQVSAWLGDEVALALTASGGETAGSLVLLAVADEAQAKAFVARGARRSGAGTSYRGVALARYGAVYAAFVGDFLALGQQATLRRAIDLQQGRGRSLAADPTFARTAGELPGDRVADAYATADGLRRLLVPAGGVLGALGVVFDRPGLRGVAASLEATEPGAEVVARADVPGRQAAAFMPSLLDAVPESAMALFVTKRLDESATRMLAAAGTANLADLIDRVRRALGAQGERSVSEDLLALLRDESAVALLPSVPAPTLLVIAKARSAPRTQAALALLARTLPRLLPGAKVTQRDGITTIASSTTELDLAVVDGKLVLSTSRQGIAAVRDPDGGIDEREAWGAVVGTPGKPVTSVVFLDFSQLLTLAEQTGLGDSRFEPDLRRVRAVGARSTGDGEDTTTEIRFQIP